MKAWMATAVAAGFMGAMSLAQAGVPAESVAKTGVSGAETGNAASAMPISASRGQSSKGDQNASKPTIPGAREAQSSALSNGQEMAIVGGAILVGGIIAAASGGGGDESSTPGTGGTTGTTGTTGTH